MSEQASIIPNINFFEPDLDSPDDDVLMLEMPMELAELALQSADSPHLYVAPATEDEACVYIKRMFEGFVDHRGCTLRAEDVCGPRNVEMVMRIEFSDAIDLFYMAMEEYRQNTGEARTQMRAADAEEAADGSIIQDDFDLFLHFKTITSRLMIPKQSQGGLLLLYIKYRYGLDL